MKKLLVSLFIFVLAFTACSKKDDEVKIYVNSDIKIEIEDIEDYPWKNVITIFIEGERQPFSGTIVERLNNEEIIPGNTYGFVAIYTYKNKEYRETFEVYVYQNIDRYLINFITFNGKVESIEVTEGNIIDFTRVSIIVEGYTFIGWYKDSACQVPFDINEKVYSNYTLYGKWSKNNEQFEMVDKETINNSLQKYIDSLISQTTSYVPSWNQEGFKGRWNYIDGVFLNSIVNMYNTTKDNKYMDFIIEYINYYIDESGNFINPQTHELEYRSGELDSICESRILFDAYEYSKDERYLSAINKTYNELMNMPLTKNGYSFSHKSDYLNQIWLDGMYMYVPFYARYAQMVNDNTIFDKITSQYKYIRDNMYDEEKRLYYHGHDTSKSVFWADNVSGNSKSFWLRSMGWYMVSLVDVLEYFPEGVNKEYLKGLLIECIEGIMKYQDIDSKMFYQLIDQGNQTVYVQANYLLELSNSAYKVNGEYVDKYIANYLESSGSSMIAYTLLKGSRLGFIESNYFQEGIKIFEGVYGHSFKNNKLNDICITAGLGPESKQYRDGSLAYYLAEPVGSNDAKGVGPFIMAYLEYNMNYGG